MRLFFWSHYVGWRLPWGLKVYHRSYIGLRLRRRIQIYYRGKSVNSCPVWILSLSSVFVNSFPNHTLHSSSLHVVYTYNIRTLMATVPAVVAVMVTTAFSMVMKKQLVATLNVLKLKAWDRVHLLQQRLPLLSLRRPRPLLCLRRPLPLVSLRRSIFRQTPRLLHKI